MKRDQVGADRGDLTEDLHHSVIGGKRRLDRGNRGLVGRQRVAQGRGGGFCRQFDHVLT